MTISLNDLTVLFDDKRTIRRIDALLENIAAAEQTIVDATATIEAVDAELRSLGISNGRDEAAVESDEASENEETPPDDDDTAEMAPPPPARPAKPRKKPAMPADDPSDPRSVSEYANALDEVAHELGAMGATGTRGVDITEAMERRGFPNGKRVLRIARAHPNWGEVPEVRSRFRYAAAVPSAVKTPSPAEGDVSEQRDPDSAAFADDSLARDHGDAGAQRTAHVESFTT